MSYHGPVVWLKPDECLPDATCADFVWVIINGEVELGRWDGERFCDAGSAGDREGLSIEQLHGVQYWAWLTHPAPPQEPRGVIVAEGCSPAPHILTKRLTAKQMSGRIVVVDHSRPEKQ